MKTANMATNHHLRSICEIMSEFEYVVVVIQMSKYLYDSKILILFIVKYVFISFGYLLGSHYWFFWSIQTCNGPYLRVTIFFVFLIVQLNGGWVQLNDVQSKFFFLIDPS